MLIFLTADLRRHFVRPTWPNKNSHSLREKKIVYPPVNNKTNLFGPKGLTGNLRPGRPEIGLRVSRGYMKRKQ